VSTRKQLDRQIAEVTQELIAAAVLTSEHIARQVGVNAVDLQTYCVLVRHGEPMTPGQVAHATELPTSTTTRVLDRLEAKALVRRTPDPDDGRKTWVHAEPFVHPGAVAAYASMLSQVEEIHAGFGVGELKTVLRYLEAVTGVRRRC
jgi:DNA-binding MarR family transcriptional regulator